MTIKKPQKRLIFQWATRKGLVTILLFLIVAALIEYSVVLYAVSLGVKDETLLRWSFPFPGADWIITIAISPIFHMVPIAVIIALMFSWTYLASHVAAIPPQKWTRKVKPLAKRKNERRIKEMKRQTARISGFFGKVKSKLLSSGGISYLWEKMSFARATIKSASAVLLVFVTLTLLMSLLTYPQLIYWTVSNVYQNNPVFLGFVTATNNFGKGIADVLLPIGWVCSAVNNALLSVAPRFRDLAQNLGGLMKPLVKLDDVEKYLVFQNVAMWVSALTMLSYGQYQRKSYRHKRSRRH
ncbi:hypothetical protein E3J49_07320 [Candidatus Bathyarchaeota archaeon]|nr:MAG: hypothetical protein E3J49_07320 [Candidatus Bathyarchaeota archaeon]